MAIRQFLSAAVRFSAAGRPSPLSRGGRWVAAFAIGATVVGCAANAGRHTVVLPVAPPTPDELIVDRSTLTAGDVVAVQFPYRPSYSHDAIIQSDGHITLPIVGPIAAFGKTTEELGAEIRTAYAAHAYTPTALPPDRQYLIGVNDKLSVRFRGADYLNTTATVRPDGRITLPLISPVTAEGVTPEQLAKQIGTAYANQLRQPEVSVSVVEFASDRAYVDGRLSRAAARDLDDSWIFVRSYSPRHIFVSGEVRTPGFVPYQPELTALQAIAAAGGAQRTAKLTRVIVLRRTGVEKPTATFIDLKADSRALAMNDIPLRPFDIVIVPKTKIAQLNDVLDQYIYQLVPLTRNINFTYFYDFRK